MQKNLLLLCVLFLFFSCQESENPNPCGVVNPVREVDWIKDAIKENEAGGLAVYSYLVQAEYKGQPVFYFGSCCPFCKFAIVVLDCQGNKLSSSISSSDLVNSKVIWKPANSICNLD